MRAVGWAVFALAIATAVQVDATFAANEGFSGRNVDCTVCHRQAAPAATPHLDGIPETWRPGETYAFDIAVTGGPPALPDPAPKGGFEIEVAAGTLDAGPGMDPLLRFPQATIGTYEPEGTLRRDWQVTWTAPSVHEAPEPVGVWLAVMAANGNHVIATNTSDGGEQGDAMATTMVEIPAAPDVVEAWEALPLEPPVIDRIIETPEGLRIEGHHADGNASYINVRLFDDPWGTASFSGPEWVVITDEETLPHLAVRSEGTGRVSPAVELAPDEAETPLPVAVLLVALAFAARVK